MKLLYLECSMGAAGDMLMSALAGLLPKPEDFVAAVNSLPLPGVALDMTACVRQGITGLHANVTINGASEDQAHAHEHTHEHAHEHAHEHTHDHDHGRIQEHTHRHDSQSHDHGSLDSLDSINALIQGLPLSEQVKQDAQSVYLLIAEAESKVHGKPVDLVHFHELGALDAVCDIVGVCMLMELLSPDKIIVSPIHVGSGSVFTAHGQLPVPTPATAELLKDIPSYGGEIAGELCTPTGAALLKYFSDEFGPMPLILTKKMGYGMGSKDFPRCNCLRAFWGQVETTDLKDTISELSCNIDDMTGEALSYAAELLRNNGALDVFLMSVQTKKNRPSTLLICLCEPADEEKLATAILKHTSTFGLRRATRDRYILSRSFTTVNTPYGPVNIKHGAGYGVRKSKPEYEDLARIAAGTGLSISAVNDVVIQSLEDEDTPCI